MQYNAADQQPLPLPLAPFSQANVQILLDRFSLSLALSLSISLPLLQSVCFTCNHSECLLLPPALAKHVSRSCMQIQLSRCNCTWLWPKTCSLDASLVQCGEMVEKREGSKKRCRERSREKEVENRVRQRAGASVGLTFILLPLPNANFSHRIFQHSASNETIHKYSEIVKLSMSVWMCVLVGVYVWVSVILVSILVACPAQHCNFVQKLAMN